MDLLRGLNNQQKQAVLHQDGPLLVVAGAGTGKTKVITRRISHLMEKGALPRNILAVTFTNKAAREMKERVGETGRGGPTIGTFHSIATDILRKHGNNINISPDFSIIDEKESSETIKSCIEKLRLDSRQFRPNYIYNLISQKKSRPVSDPDDSDNLPKNLNDITEEYQKCLKEQNSLDFDDLIRKTVMLFEKFPEVLEVYQKKWPYIHVDEYQDTDPMQDRLVSLLGQKWKNICVVGDEDQSIYGFRGADFKNILNFETKWPEAKIITLERNYRSTKKILDAANAVISRNEIRRDKNLFTKEKAGPKISVREAENEKEEADFIAGKIKSLLEKEILDSPVAILCRANSQFPVFEEAFLKHSIPYQAASSQDTLVLGEQPVRLMTVHAAKGLEFRNVFVTGLEKGLFPHSLGEKEEERRLFYVGLTRAKENLFLSYSKYRSVFGGKQINQPSPFLADIPKNLLKWL